MKSKFLLICFLGISPLLAQRKIYSTTHTNPAKPKERTEYVHNYSADGQTEIVEQWFYARPDSTPKFMSRQTLRFDAQKRLLTDESIFTTTEIRPKRQTRRKTLYENRYNTNGCRTLWQVSFFENDTMMRQFRIDSKVNAKCQVEEDHLTESGWDSWSKKSYSDVLAVKTYTYDSKDSLERIDYDFGNPNRLGYIKILKRQADGKVAIIESYEACDFCIDVVPIHAKYQVEYDGQGRIISRATYANNDSLQKPNWRPFDSTVYVYTNDRLTRETNFFSKFQSRYIDTTTINYTYDLYCDNQIRQTNIATRWAFWVDSYYQNEQILYKYTEGSNCGQLTTDDFKLYPNPTNWRTTIEAEDLFLANFKVLIVNTLGQKMADYDVDFRTPFFDFPTQDLPNGTYLVKLYNAEKTLSKKLMVAH